MISVWKILFNIYGGVFPQEIVIRNIKIQSKEAINLIYILENHIIVHMPRLRLFGRFQSWEPSV